MEYFNCYYPDYTCSDEYSSQDYYTNFESDILGTEQGESMYTEQQAYYSNYEPRMEVGELDEYGTPPEQGGERGDEEHYIPYPDWQERLDFEWEEEGIGKGGEYKYKEPEQDYQCGTQMFKEGEQDSPYWESPPQSPFEYPTVNCPLVDPAHPSYSPPQWDYDQIAPIHIQSETMFGMPQLQYPRASPYVET